MLPLRIESQYFGSIQYIKQLASAKNVVIDIHEPFKKMSYRNRTSIVSAQGPLLLTVPLQNGRDQKLPIYEVKISYSEYWPSKHLKAISSCYKRSPFFEYYEDGLTQLLNTEYPSLLDLNMCIADWLSKVLKTEFNISKTKEATSYLDPNFKDVRDTSSTSNLSQNIANQVYQQVFSDKIEFIPNASILDLIFCMGPSANIYLKDKHL